MLFAASLLLPLLVISFWVFWRLSPPRPNPAPLRWFNLAAIVASLAIGIAVALGVRETMAASSDHAAWPLVAAFYLLAAVPACLTVGGGLRRLIFGSRAPAQPLALTRDLTNTRF